MLWWVLLALVVLLVAVVLLAPLELYINTATQAYYLRLKGIVKATLEPHTEKVLRISVAVFFWRFYFYPLQYTRSPKEEEKPKKAGKRFRFTKHQFFKLLRTFRVKAWRVDLDTGDYVTNAKLFPVIGLLNLTKGTFTINFEGRNNWLVHIQNRPVHMLTALL